MSRLPAALGAALILFVVAFPGNADQVRDPGSVDRRPITHAASAAAVTPTSVEELVFATAFNKVGPPMQAGEFRRWQSSDTMLDGPLDLSPVQLRRLEVCDADAVVFGEVENQRVLFNNRRTALFAIHEVRVTESLGRGNTAPVLHVGSAGGRIVIGHDWFESALHGDVPVRGVETLFFLDSLPKIQSAYRITLMAEPIQERFHILGLSGSRSRITDRLRQIISECPSVSR